MADLDSLSRGFRESYLDYDALTAQLKAWADAFPDVTRLRSLGTTPEGRELWLLTIGRSPDEVRPAAWIDGNMHASELAGSSVCLTVAEDLLALHARGASNAIERAALEGLVHVMPRVSPDGAEAVLADGRYVRSVPRDDRTQRAHPRWIHEDIDGDGLSLVMRVEDPAGDMVESAKVPGVMVPRTIADEGPFYRLFPEGRIEHWDGETIPDPTFLADNDPDLNRNFPYHWAPEPDQVGAGRFPMSEIESRVLVEFASANPNLFVWVNLHTFGGVFIRPLGAAPDSKMQPFDRAIFRQVEAWGDELTGYPTVSGFEQFTYEPDKPLHGDLLDFTYHQRGCLTWVCELWDLFEQVGLPKQKRFVDRYTHLSREDIEAIAAWDRESNESKVVRPWRKVEHDQLGDVEVGGLDPRFGLWNPPTTLLAGICGAQSELFLRTVAMLPRLEISATAGENCVEVTVCNVGYLPTHGLDVGAGLAWNEAPYLDVLSDGSIEVLPSERHRKIGHLDGWGRGLHGGFGALYFSRSHGNRNTRTFRVHPRGKGTLKFRAGSSRVGYVQCEWVAE